ncbi:uncharacterized protein LOC131852480 [Achroia grisella]|uniref:uncharacterized protein LOC131852480 n=1 Tax=Achroia grisella TaxID=688607 RepID=UPI0027D312A4|nr:uncharacterized protein LOC131852480 [Achroia grisella]
MSRKDKDAPTFSPSRQLIMLEAKRNALFQRIQSIYDKSKSATESEEKRRMFLSSCITIDDVRNKFQDVLDEYNSRMLDENPSAVPNFHVYDSFEDLFCSIKQTFSDLSSAPTGGNSCGIDAPVSRPRLPPLELVSFSGNYQDWNLFYASYKSTVHDNSSLTNSEKLYYLLGKLSPKVQSVFAGITPCAENYEIIFKSLLDKYQDIHVLGSNYLDQILNLKLGKMPSAASFQLFIDKYVTAAMSLKGLGIKQLSDFILLYIAKRKFDSETLRAFELHSSITKSRDFDGFINFIKTQCRIYENTQPAPATSTESNKYRPPTNKYRPPAKYPDPQSYVSSVTPIKCSLCNSNMHDHFYKCSAFEKLSPLDRYKHIKANNSCVNCLSTKHKSGVCTSKSSCRACQKRHHSLLHFVTDRGSLPARDAPAPRSSMASPPLPSHSGEAVAKQSGLSLCALSNKTVLLATARVIVYDALGKQHLVRCLLDSASQSNFITDECCDRLGLLNELKYSSTMVKGIGGSQKNVKVSVEFNIFSRFNFNVHFNISALVVDRITDSLPSVPVNTAAFSHIKNLPLADGEFAIPSNIDVLIGSSIFPHLLLPGIVHSKHRNIPPAIQTVLGFVIMGSVPTFNSASPNSALLNTAYTTSCCSVIHDRMDTLFQSFWELEEITAPPAQSADDLECEHYFRATTTRDDSGRYIVSLPFREDVFSLGDSFAAAHRRYLCLERKLEASPHFRFSYNEVIRAYIDKGYLSPVKSHQDNSLIPSYYIPHHGVLREDKVTTKLRVVLDASCKTTSGRSLNDILHSGTNLQVDEQLPRRACSHPGYTQTLSDKSFDNSTPHKILGLFWDNSNDSFKFKVITPDAICTKRAILSAVARLWDILGFVAPAILYAKLLIKELWLLKCDWDAQPPHHIIAAWRQFCLELPSLNRLRIPRHLGVVEDCQLNILGFADASERAYGGVVYLHIQVDNKYFVQLLCAKSKVSPVKIVSIARLELCAAVLLAKLLRKVVDTIAPRYPVNNIYAFSDSKVALCWIHSSPHRWQTFVANRVVQIIDNVPADCFYHVAGSDNPADCLSRGLTPDKLVNHPLWYTGPSWVLSNRPSGHLLLITTYRMKTFPNNGLLYTH